MTSDQIEKVIDFYIKYLGQLDKDKAREQILEHLKFGTVDYAVDDKGNIIGLCRWNISECGTVAKVIDLAIDPKWRKQGVGRSFLVRGLKLWKNVTHVEFERGARGDHRRKLIPIKYILKHGIF